MEEDKLVYEIAQDFYGENNVDFVSHSEDIDDILIKWDKVTIKNEKGQTHTIYDLYGKLTIKNGLFISIKFKRSTFTSIELSNGYIHSHITRIWNNSSTRDIRQWHDCCFGRGPIRGTIATLAANFDADRWRLFFYELDKFVHIESLIGGPYIRLSSLTSKKAAPIQLGPRSTKTYNTNNAFWKNFIKKLITEGVFSFTFDGLKYDLDQSYSECIIKVTRKFLEYCKTILTDSQLSKCIADCTMPVSFDGFILYDSNFTLLQDDTPVLRFKDTDIHLKLIGSEDKLRVLNPDIFNYTLYVILNFINTEYGI